MTANLVDLTGIVTMGSSGFLLVFAIVNAANFRLAGETHSRRWLASLGIVACVLALVALPIETASDNVAQVLTLPLMVGLSVGVESAYRRLRPHRRPQS